MGIHIRAADQQHASVGERLQPNGASRAQRRAVVEDARAGRAEQRLVLADRRRSGPFGVDSLNIAQFIKDGLIASPFLHWAGTCRGEKEALLFRRPSDAVSGVGPTDQMLRPE